MWYGKFNFAICSVCQVSLIIESEKVDVTEGATFNLSLIKYRVIYIIIKLCWRF